MDPLLLGELVLNVPGSENIYSLVLDKRPCCWPGCTGYLYNSSLAERIHDYIYDNRNSYSLGDAYPGKFDKLVDIIKEIDLIREKTKPANMYTTKITINGKQYTKSELVDTDCGYEDEESFDHDKVFNPIGSFCSVQDGFDQIRCSKCDNWYICCLECKKPCIFRGFYGDFCEKKTKPNKQGETVLEWGRSIRLQREVKIIDDKKVEYIRIKSNEDNVNVLSCNPTADPALVIIDEAGMEEDEGGMEEDEPEYNIEDKRIIWARDPRVNLHIDGSVFAPLHCGTDGGFQVYYKCDTCEKTGEFTDK